ncbi:hypothetical protein [Ruegeria marina]|uniref:Uncharacterized protein n=1 Tax=Ruegeria marina TaxID=639004 RepID=A0A1G6LGE6_9RHOB|nr:hypothetical protein [Ruegeria marina]SDC42502.1 hypothetical protein SAMN04488239_102240 [Ruegeria marina]
MQYNNPFGDSSIVSSTKSTQGGGTGQSNKELMDTIARVIASTVKKQMALKEEAFQKRFDELTKEFSALKSKLESAEKQIEEFKAEPQSQTQGGTEDSAPDLNTLNKMAAQHKAAMIPFKSTRRSA